jgi:RloB-like protein
MGQRHQRPSLARRSPSRQPKHRILIVCEGENTEPLYFKQFQHKVRNPRVHVKAIGPAGVPRSVVETAISEKEKAEQEAKRERDENLRWDQVWAVFDVDDHPKRSEAIQLADSNAISLAISNPCFELWAFLHFQDQQAHIERDKLRQSLKAYLPRYDKELEFETVHAGYDAAVTRARQLDDIAVKNGDPGRNPTTGVYRLTEVIRSS